MSGSGTGSTQPPEPEGNRLRPSARASIGGVGGGTGLVAIAQSVGSDTTLGAILLYLAPTVSFVVGALLLYLETQASRFLERRVIKGARKTLQAQLEDRHTSVEHKARIRAMLEEMETSVAWRELERARIIGVSSGAGPASAAS
jgi:hypothetical protein